jgi:hypothetical protein
MEAMLRISHHYLKLANMPCLSYYLLYFLFNKIRYKRVAQVLPGSRGSREGWGGGPNNVYTYK